MKEKATAKTNDNIHIDKLLYFGIKRAFDICCGLLGCIPLLPIMLIVKILYMITGDFHSIFYTQARIGKNGKKIYMLKFRTMIPNADKEPLETLLKDPKYKKEWDLNQKFENDPRITTAGKILRKTSLDELPQLINVLKGDMSLVGPRPFIPNEPLPKQPGKERYYVRPGMTGLAQVSGGRNITHEKKLEYDSIYYNNISFFLDLKIIIKTPIQLLKE